MIFVRIFAMFREIFELNLFKGAETGSEYFLTNSFIFHI